VADSASSQKAVKNIRAICSLTTQAETSLLKMEHCTRAVDKSGKVGGWNGASRNVRDDLRSVIV
jgi:hypothetical protein